MTSDNGGLSTESSPRKRHEVTNSGGSDDLRERIQKLEQENQALREQLSVHQAKHSAPPPSSSRIAPPASGSALSATEIERYSRQLLVAGGFGIAGQQKLSEASVLIVGAGGIASTAIPYLAAAGVSHLAVVDMDHVDVNNLHRQIIHKSAHVGLNKAVSAQRMVQDLNPLVTCTVHKDALTHDNAFDLIQKVDCVLDCSDNPKTRFLVNDACVLAGVPLVSASAIGTEGQLTVYNYSGGPCYRCLYPKPSVTADCRSCSDMGVLGTVPGLMGVLQATEALKILAGGWGRTLHDRFLTYDAHECSFMNLKKPARGQKCPVCGDSPTITDMEASRASLAIATGPSAPRHGLSLPPELQIACTEYAQMREGVSSYILLDVRVQQQYELCHLPESVHVPLSRLPQELDRLEELSKGSKPIYCICRRGIDSVEATDILHSAKSTTHPGIHSVKNIEGGLTAWRREVDETFPRY